MASSALAQAVGANPAGSAQADQGYSVGEVIVTAQRREESARDVPLSVSSISAEQLTSQGVGTIKDLATATPGVVIGLKGNFVQPVIRGISAQGTGPGIDSAVALYVDGVYQANQIANVFELADVERVEVLKGPQGTLFGRNATGGAIQIVTKEPAFDTEGVVNLTYGSFDEFKATGYVTGAIIDDLLAFSLSGYHRKNSGYNKDRLRGGYVGGVDSDGVRLKLRWQPVSTANILLTGFYSDVDDATGQAGAPYLGNSIVKRTTPSIALATRPWEVSNNVDPSVKIKNRGANLKAEFDLGFADLTSLTAYNKVEVRVIADSDRTSSATAEIRQRITTESVSQEVSLASSGEGRLQWIAGANYYKEEAANDPLYIFNNGATIPQIAQFGQQDTEAYAAFAELTFSLTDRLRVIGGARYNYETKSFAFTANPNGILIPVGKKDYDSVTPRVSVLFEATPDINLYATYSKGFKSGTFNPSSNANVPLDPEEISAYEVGVKGRVGSRFSFDVAAFSYEYSNQQVTTIVGQLSILQNAASGTSQGIDANAVWQVNDNWQLRGGASVLQAEYENFTNASVNVPRTDCAQVGATFPCGNVAVLRNVSGNPFIRAPEFTANLTAAYTTQFQGGELRLSATGYWNSGFAWEVGNRVQQDAYGTLAAEASWQLDNSGLKFAVSGRNLTNEAYLLSENDSAAVDGISWAEPRWIGGTISYAF